MKELRSDTVDAAVPPGAIALWDLAIEWQIAYNVLYQAMRRGRIPGWRDARGRIQTDRAAAERWRAARFAPTAPPDDVPDTLLPIRQAAACVGLSRATVQRAVTRGFVTATRDPAGLWLVSLLSLRAHLLSHAAIAEEDTAWLPPPAPLATPRPAASPPSPEETAARRQVMVTLLRDLGGRVERQTALLAQDLDAGDVATIQHRASDIRQLTDTIEEVRTVFDEWEDA